MNSVSFEAGLRVLQRVRLTAESARCYVEMSEGEFIENGDVRHLVEGIYEAGMNSTLEVGLERVSLDNAPVTMRAMLLVDAMSAWLTINADHPVRRNSASEILLVICEAFQQSETSWLEDQPGGSPVPHHIMQTALVDQHVQASAH